MAAKVTREVDLVRFMQAFSDEYEFMGKFRDSESGIQEYYDIVDAGDEFMKAHEEFVGEFAKAREDYVTSDREVAAFVLAALMYGNFDDDFKFMEEVVA